jgi:hypothetical protein
MDADNSLLTHLIAFAVRGPSRRAAEILAHHNESELWSGLLTHKSPDIRLRTLQYLVDRRDGKAKQAVEVSGGWLHAHTTYRDPRLAALSQEEIQQLDAITRKLLPPASTAAEDGPQNQIESNTAIEAADAIESPSQPREQGH